MKIALMYTAQTFGYLSTNAAYARMLSEAYSRCFMTAIRECTPRELEVVGTIDKADVVICIVGGNPISSLQVGEDIRMFQDRCKALNKPIVLVSPLSGITPWDYRGEFEITSPNLHPPTGNAPQEGLEYSSVTAWATEFKMIVLQAVEKMKQQGEKLAAT